MSEADAVLTASERMDDVEAMARALEPFAVAADAYDPDDGDGHYAAWGCSPLIGQLRAARASLTAYCARHHRPDAQPSGNSGELDAPPALPHREDAGPGGVAFKYSDNLADATQKNDLAHFAAVTCRRLEAMKIRAKAANKRADAAEAALATARREAGAEAYEDAARLVSEKAKAMRAALASAAQSRTERYHGATATSGLTDPVPLERKVCR